ncbi:DUF6268 family outer membrane beta-barrel protein [Flavobacterium adhaerens]|uniref:DUF6268 family outer membrane beta-barrel protein n=1 Tax=Flavobacterium adhaerens TaxID=3149043 RepID=UPI0032B4B7C6
MRIHNFIKLIFLIPVFGAYAQNGASIDFDTKTEPIDNGTIKQTEVSIQLFKEIGTENKLRNTLKYKSTSINDEIETYIAKDYDSNYDKTHFNTISNLFEFSHQLNDKSKLIVNIEPQVNFQNSISFSDFTILGGIEWYQTINDKNNFGLGIKRMTVFGKPQLLPTFEYNHQFNSAVALKLGFPNSILTYSNNTRNIFSLNNDFSGSIYNLESSIITDDSRNLSKVGFSQMETTLQYERNFDKSWFIGLKGGYSSNKEFKFSDENRDSETNQKLKNGSVFSISIKYKL